MINPFREEEIVITRGLDVDEATLCAVSSAGVEND